MVRLRRAGKIRHRFAVLASLSTFLTLLGGVFFARSLLAPDTGLLRYDPEVVVRQGQVLFFPSAPFTAPAAAGVLPERDTILSLNGQRIAGTRDLVRAALGVKSFDPYTITVKRDGSTTLTIAVKPYFRPSRLDWIFELVFCLMLAAAAFTLCWRMPHAASTIPLVLSALLSLVFTCIRPFSYESVLANLVANAGNISSWLLVIFAMLFPWKRGSPRDRAIVVGLVIALYAAFCVLRAGMFARWLATGLEGALSDYRRLGQLVIVSDGAAYAVLAALLASAYARSRLPRDRRMLEWLLAGVLIAFPPYFFLDQLPLILGGQVHQLGLGSLAQLFLSILPLFLLLALTSRTAINFRSFLIRYGIYGTLLLIATGLFTVAYIPLRDSMVSAYRLASPLPDLLAAGILIVAVAVLRLPVERVFARAESRGGSLRAASAAPLSGEGLHALIQLTEENARSLHASKLLDTRSIIRGIVRTLYKPVRVLAAGAADAGTAEQKEAGAEAEYFLGTLESLAGTASSPASSVSPGSIAQAAVDRVQGRFPGTAFELQEDGAGRIFCHGEEVIQAVSLVLENAAESEEGGQAEVRINASADRARVLLEVADDGPGIDALARRRLFRPFWTTKPGHRGLGLYFARIIVERNDGGIEICRGESGGTIVRLAFPRIVEEG
jgi:signal transduction histidine kinase